MGASENIFGFLLDHTLLIPRRKVGRWNDLKVIDSNNSPFKWYNLLVSVCVNRLLAAAAAATVAPVAVGPDFLLTGEMAGRLSDGDSDEVVLVDCIVLFGEYRLSAMHKRNTVRFAKFALNGNRRPNGKSSKSKSDAWPNYFETEEQLIAVFVSVCVLHIFGPFISGRVEGQLTTMAIIQRTVHWPPHV